MTPEVTVIGAGLAGCEVAWQLAQRGLTVRVKDMKPARRTPAQRGDGPAELVCSNSLRSNNPANAVGLLKEELRRLGSLILEAADATRVPAGDALAVDRDAFSALIAERLRRHANIELVSEHVRELPSAALGPAIVATGPLTDDDLAASIAGLTGSERLYFYDALAPIIAAESIDRTIVFAASRYDKGDGADYLNCPLDRVEYERFLDALISAESMPLHAFEQARYFQGCQPVEVIAQSGRDSLRFGPMKPVGLTDPRTGRRPYAVVQLRQEDRFGQAYNLVGFQTKMTYPEQDKIIRLIPGLAGVVFLRHGAMHRNTYLDSPLLLDARMRCTKAPHLRFAGQITGVEGYVESAAHGLITALLTWADLTGAAIESPPATTALGALCAHVRGAARSDVRTHEPQNINWGLFEPLPAGTPKRVTKVARVERARTDLARWADAAHLELRPPSWPTTPADVG